MQKIRYEIDPYNRLVAKGPYRKTALPKFRKVLDGRFRVNENNEVTYHLKTPVSGDETIPHQIKLRGRWSLTDSHDLRLTMDKAGRRTFGDSVTLRGEIIGVNKSSLLFAVSTRTKDSVKSTYALDLQGVWKVDANNRLLFRAKKEHSTGDIFLLTGAWEINKNHQVKYSYTKKYSEDKQKLHALTFKGHWDITGKARISYMLEGDTEPSFTFRTSAGIFKEGYIKYEIGIKINGRPEPVKRSVALFGVWRFKKGKELYFETVCGDGKLRRITFIAEAAITAKDTVIFRLRRDIGSGRGSIELKLSRKILKGNGEAFLRLLKSKRESAIYAGYAWQW